MAYKFAVFHFRPTFTTSFAIPADWDKKKLKWDNGNFFYKGKQIEVPRYVTDAQDQYEEYSLSNDILKKCDEICFNYEELDDEGICFDFEVDIEYDEDDNKYDSDDEDDTVEKWVKHNIARIPVD